MQKTLLTVHSCHKYGCISSLSLTLRLSHGLLHRVKTLVDATICSKYCSNVAPFDVSGTLFLEDGYGFCFNYVLPLLSLDYVIELALCGSILEYAYYVAEFNNGISGDDINHFTRVKSSCVNHIKSISCGLPCYILRLH